MPASPYDIITAQDVKLALKIADETESFDEVIDDIVSGVSQGIEDFLGRPVAARNVSESLDGDGTDTLLLKPYLESVTTVTIDSITIAAGDRVFYPKTGKVQLKYTSFTCGLQNVALAYRHGWETQDIPKSIKRGAVLWCLHHFKLTDKNRIGVNSVTAGDQTISFTASMPADVRELLTPYMLAGFGS
jgi:hypothetical protein